MAEQIKAVASILSEMKTSVLMMLLAAWLMPQAGQFVLQWQFADSLADSFGRIADSIEDDIRLQDEHRKFMQKTAEWMVDDERRDSTLHSEQVRILQAVEKWLDKQ